MPGIDVLSQALVLVLSPEVLVTALVAGAFGMFIGAMPGLTATMATALLVPLTFFMEPIPALAAIVSASSMAIFAGDIPGALLRIPGTPASAAYVEDSHRLTLQGRLNEALGTNLIVSCIGGLIGHRRTCGGRAAAGGIRAEIHLVRIFLAGDVGSVMRDLRGFQ